MTRVLFVTRNFSPVVGGMENLMKETYHQLSYHYTVDLIGPKGSKKYLNNNKIIKECELKPLLFFFIKALFKSSKLAIKFKPSVIFSGSGVTAPITVITGKIFRIPVIVYVHGLDLIYPSWFYSNFIVPFIKMADRVIANSTNTASIAESVGVSTERIRILNPGVDIVANRSVNSDFKDKYSLSNKTVLLSLGRLVPRKGVIEFLENIFPKVLNEHPDVIFAIVGPDYSKNKIISENIRGIIERNQWKKNVYLMGECNEEELLQLWTYTNFLVFPLIDIPGDVEGFGMVAIEAASYGVPTIAYRVGGVTDAVSEGKSGYLIEPGDYNKFSSKLNKMLLEKDGGISKESCMNYAKEYSWETYGEVLHKYVEEILKKNDRVEK
jgi:phosphatidyl-myo-inositol dimannoside synthase